MTQIIPTVDFDLPGKQVGCACHTLLRAVLMVRWLFLLR
jgi:hypothetical protein